MKEVEVESEQKLKTKRNIRNPQKRVPPLYEIEAMNQTYLEPFSSVCVYRTTGTICAAVAATRRKVRRLCSGGAPAAVLCGVRCARFHSIPHARTRHQSSLSFLLAKILCCFKQVDNLERANKEV